MRPAALSILVFGVYVLLNGVSLLLAPAQTLSLLGVPAPEEVWIRVVGALALVLGYYYVACARAGATAFFRATVGGRVGFALLCGLLVLAFGGPVQLLLFAAVDVAGAAWTRQALHRERTV